MTSSFSNDKLEKFLLTYPLVYLATFTATNSYDRNPISREATHTVMDGKKRS